MPSPEEMAWLEKQRILQGWQGGGQQAVPLERIQELDSQIYKQDPRAIPDAQFFPARMPQEGRGAAGSMGGGQEHAETHKKAIQALGGPSKKKKKTLEQLAAELEGELAGQEKAYANAQPAVQVQDRPRYDFGY